MILLDSDVLVDLMREYPAAVSWLNGLSADEEVAVPGYVVMELSQGSRNRGEQDRVQRELAPYGVVWLAPSDCDRALEVFAAYHLSHHAGLLDALIGQTAVALGAPLYTSNQKHYRFMPGMQTIQPYTKSL